MSSLKLVNNSGLDAEKNLCFVNTALQLLFCIPEVRSFFCNQEFNRSNTAAETPVCNEISRISSVINYQERRKRTLIS